MEIAVLRERYPKEGRVAIDPTHLPHLAKLGCTLRVEAGAGDGAGWSDEDYRAAGAQVESDRARLLDGVQCILKVRPPTDGSEGSENEVALLPRGSLLLSLLSPGASAGLLDALAAQGISALAMERVPRTTRAQRMDVLSSQATAAGYHAVLLAATRLPRFFPMLTTAAGTIRPAKVTVLGAGVAGLQAIATARKLGAVVQGYDIRAAAAEQVRSLGATFLQEEEEEEEEHLPEGAEGSGGYARALGDDEKTRQLAFLDRRLPESDVIITTAQIPGRTAPLLVTRKAVEGMKRGSVIVDLAGETGGNCELSRAGETVLHQGVTILAPIDLPSGVAQHASAMYGTNLLALLKLIVKEGEFALDLEDDIVNAVLATHEGKVRTPGGGKS